jgi:hypothetical protein
MKLLVFYSASICCMYQNNQALRVFFLFNTLTKQNMRMKTIVKLGAVHTRPGAWFAQNPIEQPVTIGFASGSKRTQSYLDETN